MFMSLEKLLAELKAAQGAVVVATNRYLSDKFWIYCLIAGALSYANLGTAATLPEERADILFHSYDSGDITISGPSVLVRKNFKEAISVYGNYYVDQVSSASIDVITSGASAYEEERTEYSLGAEYLYDKSTISLSGTQSTENDYEAKTLSFDISQDFFGDMTSLSMGYTYGDDIVRKAGNETFEEATKRARFRLGINQILTPKWMLGLSLESASDEGFLNNPYRTTHYLITTTEGSTSVGSQDERYPNTRNSDSIALRTIYYLPYKASIRGEIRSFSDNWGIKANNAELRYIHPYRQVWRFQASIRSYQQGQADFYSDLFPFFNSQDFIARDKELSEYSSLSLGLGVLYEIKRKWAKSVDKTTLSLQFDHMEFDYQNFHDATGRLDGSSGFAPGEEPLYSLSADIVRFFVSIYY
jgi:hypothetical protein